MAESDNDDKVGEDDSDGHLETSRKLFFKKAKGNKKKKPGRRPSGVHGHLMNFRYDRE